MRIAIAVGSLCLLALSACLPHTLSAPLEVVINGDYNPTVGGEVCLVIDVRKGQRIKFVNESGKDAVLRFDREVFVREKLAIRDGKSGLAFIRGSAASGESLYRIQVEGASDHGTPKVKVGDPPTP